MMLPKWFVSLFRKTKPEGTQNEMDLAYSDYMRTKYGIPQTFSKEDNE